MNDLRNVWWYKHQLIVQAKDALALLFLDHGYKETDLYDLADEAVEEARGG